MARHYCTNALTRASSATPPGVRQPSSLHTKFVECVPTMRSTILGLHIARNISNVTAIVQQAARFSCTLKQHLQALAGTQARLTVGVLSKNSADYIASVLSVVQARRDPIPSHRPGCASPCNGRCCHAPSVQKTEAEWYSSRCYSH
jgi:hypothetical protein